MKENVLLVWPGYYSVNPPLGLLKYATYERERGNNVKLVHPFSKYNKIRNFKSWCVENSFGEFKPDRILITTLFTWAWREVHEVIYRCQQKYKDVPIRVGGIYATLMPEHLKKVKGIEVVQGIIDELEAVRPAYDLVPEWNTSILNTSRGCIRKCEYCAVKKIEGNPSHLFDIRHQINDKHEAIMVCDNNIMAHKYLKEILSQIKESGKKVDFIGGIDVRLVNDSRIELFKGLKVETVRLAYDTVDIRDKFFNAVEILKKHKITSNLFTYMLFNFEDHPDDFVTRVADGIESGVRVYPMRFEPLNALSKKKYIGKLWNKKQLKAVRRIMNRWGFYGGFRPPYTKLVNHLRQHKTFDNAIGDGNLNLEEE